MLYLRIWDQRGRSPVWYEGSRAPPLNFHLHSVRTWIQQLLLEAPIQELGLSLCDAFLHLPLSVLAELSVLTELPVSPSSLGCAASVWPRTAPSAGGVDTSSEVLGNTFFFLLLFLFLCNSWSSSASKKIQKWLIGEKDYGLSHSIRIITKGF